MSKAENDTKFGMILWIYILLQAIFIKIEDSIMCNNSVNYVQ